MRFSRLHRYIVPRLVLPLGAPRPADVDRGEAARLAGLAAQLLEEGGALAGYPEVVITFAETLTPANAATIEESLRDRVVNYYSSWEVPQMAQTCPDNPSVLHVNADRVILRVVREDGTDAPPGETGRVLVTDLGNHVMPFVYYGNGDRAVIGEACPCGRGLPTLARLEGRDSEVLRTPEAGDQRRGPRPVPGVRGRRHPLRRRVPGRAERARPREAPGVPRPSASIGRSRKVVRRARGLLRFGDEGGGRARGRHSPRAIGQAPHHQGARRSSPGRSNPLARRARAAPSPPERGRGREDRPRSSISDRSGSGLDRARVISVSVQPLVVGRPDELLDIAPERDRVRRADVGIERLLVLEHLDELEVVASSASS